MNADDVVQVLRQHMWADRRNQTCGCGWEADPAWMTDLTTPNRVNQWLSHVADELIATERRVTS